MNSIQTPLQKAEAAIAEADYILIGAGAGLSTAAGINYAGPEFEAAFKDMIERYGFTDLYTSSFYPFKTEEEKWAYWSRHIDYARFAPEAKPLYKRLLEMVQGKEYFVITTNVDGQFVKAGFDPDKVFEVQGDYGLVQCATACHPGRYSNESLVKQMVEQQLSCSFRTCPDMSSLRWADGNQRAKGSVLRGRRALASPGSALLRLREHCLRKETGPAGIRRRLQHTRYHPLSLRAYGRRVSTDNTRPHQQRLPGVSDPGYKKLHITLFPVETAPKTEIYLQIFLISVRFFLPEMITFLRWLPKNRESNSKNNESRFQSLKSCYSGCFRVKIIGFSDLRTVLKTFVEIEPYLNHGHYKQLIIN